MQNEVVFISRPTVRTDGETASSDAELHWSIGNKKRRSWSDWHGQPVGVFSSPVHLQFRDTFVRAIVIQTIADPHGRRYKIFSFTRSLSNDCFSRGWG